MTTYTAHPDYVVPTGDFIEEWMEEEGINAAELARRLDVSRKHVSELLRGKAPLSHDMALRLENTTGVPARIWNLHETGYQAALARQAADAKLIAQYDRAKEFPLGYLRKHSFITAPARDKAGTVRGLLQFFGISSMDAFQATWNQGAVAYRRSAVGHHNPHRLATWLRAAERSCTPGDFPIYDRENLEAALPELRSLTVEDPVQAIQKAQALLRDCGVALTLVPAVPGLGTHGATRWIREHPLVQLSDLWKCDDQLWFTLFHEIAHVLLHESNGLYLNNDHDNLEKEANAYASRFLVPEDYEDRLPRHRNLDEVKALAKELGIAPSIVLGQAQHRTGDYAWGHSLKRKVSITGLAA